MRALAIFAGRKSRLRALGGPCGRFGRRFVSGLERSVGARGRAAVRGGRWSMIRLSRSVLGRRVVDLRRRQTVRPVLVVVVGLVIGVVSPSARSDDAPATGPSQMLSNRFVTSRAMSAVPMLAVPDVKGQSLAYAVAIIEHAGLRPHYGEVFDTAGAFVLEETPHAGTSVPRGTDVYLALDYPNFGRGAGRARHRPRGGAQRARRSFPSRTHAQLSGRLRERPGTSSPNARQARQRGRVDDERRSSRRS